MGVFYGFFFQSIVLFRMMTVMFVSMFMVMELFLLSCFRFWFADDNKSIFNKLSNLLSLELSCFRFAAWTTFRAWRLLSWFLFFLILVLWFEVWFFVVLSFFIVSTTFTATLSSAFPSPSSTLVTSIFSLLVWFFIVFIFGSAFSWSWVAFLFFFSCGRSLLFGIFLSNHSSRSFNCNYRLWGRSVS